MAWFTNKEHFPHEAYDGSIKAPWDERAPVKEPGRRGIQAQEDFLFQDEGWGGGDDGSDRGSELPLFQVPVRNTAR